VTGKQIYLIRGTNPESYSDFEGRIFNLAREALERENLTNLKVNYTAKSPPGFSIIPFRKDKLAVISLAPRNEVLAPFTSQAGYCGAFQVTEALPVAYQKDWPDGEATPGHCLMTLFRQKKGLDYKTFLDRWHNGHTPLSLKIHPLWNYNRNLVDQSLDESHPKFDGIVEEQIKDPSDLFNPFRFFGSPLSAPYRMIQVYLDVKSFIDYPSIETYLTEEVWVKS